MGSLRIRLLRTELCRELTSLLCILSFKVPGFSFIIRFIDYLYASGEPYTGMKVQNVVAVLSFKGKLEQNMNKTLLLIVSIFNFQGFIKFKFSVEGCFTFQVLFVDRSKSVRVF